MPSPSMSANELLSHLLCLTKRAILDAALPLVLDDSLSYEQLAHSIADSDRETQTQVQSAVDAFEHSGALPTVIAASVRLTASSAPESNRFMRVYDLPCSATVGESVIRMKNASFAHSVCIVCGAHSCRGELLCVDHVPCCQHLGLQSSPWDGMCTVDGTVASDGDKEDYVCAECCASLRTGAVPPSALGCGLLDLCPLALRGLTLTEQRILSLVEFPTSHMFVDSSEFVLHPMSDAALLSGGPLACSSTSFGCRAAFPLHAELLSTTFAVTFVGPCDQAVLDSACEVLNSFTVRRANLSVAARWLHSNNQFFAGAILDEHALLSYSNGGVPSELKDNFKTLESWVWNDVQQLRIPAIVRMESYEDISVLLAKAFPFAFPTGNHLLGCAQSIDVSKHARHLLRARTPAVLQDAAMSKIAMSVMFIHENHYRAADCKTVRPLLAAIGGLIVPFGPPAYVLTLRSTQSPETLAGYRCPSFPTRVFSRVDSIQTHLHMIFAGLGVANAAHCSDDGVNTFLNRTVGWYSYSKAASSSAVDTSIFVWVEGMPNLAALKDSNVVQELCRSSAQAADYHNRHTVPTLNSLLVEAGDSGGQSVVTSLQCIRAGDHARLLSTAIRKHGGSGYATSMTSADAVVRLLPDAMSSHVSIDINMGAIVDYIMYGNQFLQSPEYVSNPVLIPESDPHISRYLDRGPLFRHLNFYDFHAFTFDSSRPPDVLDSIMGPQQAYLPGSMLGTLPCVRECLPLNRMFTVAFSNFDAGCWTDDTKIELQSACLLFLFKPWRHIGELSSGIQLFEEALGNFLTNASPEVKVMVENVRNQL